MASKDELPGADASERELALWMLDRMADSERFLADIRAARVGQAPDVMDTPEFVGKHKARLAPLYQGGTAEQVELSDEVVAMMAILAERDVRAGREDVIEKALLAYLEENPKGGEGLPKFEPSTVELARAEVEGRVQGAFREGFVAELAGAARVEIARRQAASQSISKGRKA